MFIIYDLVPTMKKPLFSIALALVLPLSVYAVEVTPEATDFVSTLVENGQTPSVAIDALMVANPDLPLADALAASLAAGVDLNTVMAIALDKAPDATSAVAAVTEAALANGMTLEQVAAAAQAVGVPGDVIAAGIAQAQDATGAGNPDTDTAELAPVVVPAPPANAGQPIS